MAEKRVAVGLAFSLWLRRANARHRRASLRRGGHARLQEDLFDRDRIHFIQTKQRNYLMARRL